MSGGCASMPVMTWAALGRAVYNGVREILRKDQEFIPEEWQIIVHPKTWGDLLRSEDKPEWVEGVPPSLERGLNSNAFKVYGVPLWTDRSVPDGAVYLRYEMVVHSA